MPHVSKLQPSGGRTSETTMIFLHSELVVAEVRAGDPDAAAKRLKLLQGVSELKITDEVRQIAAILVEKGALPGKAQADALHIATATVHGMDYLLTWNCCHIDNPAMKPLVRKACNTEGYLCPEICTPIEIMEVGENECAEQVY